jgi:small subunit ribosomal protein S20
VTLTPLRALTISARRGDFGFRGHFNQLAIAPSGPNACGRVSKHEFQMANTKSARKAARQAIRKTEINKSRRTALRNSMRKVEEAIASGDRAAATAALKAAEPAIMRASQLGVIHKNNASRTVSRLTHRVAKLAK